MAILNFKKKTINKLEQRNEVNSYVEANLQRLYSYTTWACGNKNLADNVMQKALKEIKEDIDSNIEVIDVRKGFLKALKHQCDMHLSHISYPSAPTPTVNQSSAMKTSFKVLINKIPEKYRQPLIMQIIGRFSIPEISYILEINELEATIRLSAARKMLAGFAALEYSVNASIEAHEIEMIAATDLNNLHEQVDRQAQMSA